MEGSPIVPIGSLSWGSMSGPDRPARWRGVTTRSAASRTLRQALQSPASAGSAASHQSPIAALLRHSALRLPPRREFIGPLRDIVFPRTALTRSLEGLPHRLVLASLSPICDECRRPHPTSRSQRNHDLDRPIMT